MRHWIMSYISPQSDILLSVPLLIANSISLTFGCQVCQNIGVSITQKISALKQAEGITVRGLAKAANLHENTVRSALSGGNMTISTAERVLTVLGHQLIVVPQDANILSASEDDTL